MSQKCQQYSGGARLDFKMNLVNCKIGLKYTGDYPIEKIHSVIIIQIPYNTIKNYIYRSQEDQKRKVCKKMSW